MKLSKLIESIEKTTGKKVILKEIESSEENILRSIIKKYVNHNEIDKGLLNFKVDKSLKYSGKGFRLIPVSKKDLENLIQGETIQLKKYPVLSFSKSLKGLNNFLVNMQSDGVNKFKNAILIERNIQISDCIIDITKYGKKYPNDLSNSDYADFIKEEEVITKNFIQSKITKKEIRGYLLNDKFTKI